MGHWLEESEQIAERQRQKPERFALKVERKKQMIADNYQKHSADYDRFTSTLKNLVNRVIALPEPMRPTFSKLTIQAKKTKLNNRLQILTGSRRERKRVFSLWRFLQFGHTKHIRVMYLYVSKQLGYVDFELKENRLERKRLDHKGENIKSGKEANKHRLHVVVRFPMEKLNNETALQIIDWLVFRNELDELNFWSTIPDEEKLYF